MKTNSNAVGLSAGQKINFHFNKPFWVILILLILLLVSVAGTNGQEKELKKNHPNKNPYEPKVDIKVNRHYDNQGNIIGYDSTYSSFYSNIQGDTSRMHNMIKLDEFLGKAGVSLFDNHFDQVFFKDTLMSPYFFHNDFFGSDFFLNHEVWHKLLDNMTQQMDSLKRGIIEQKNKRLNRARDRIENFKQDNCDL